MVVPDLRARAPGGGLQLDGPKIPIEVAVPAVLAKFLARNGLPVPAARKGFALIDTGASITAVDNDVVASLGIQPIGQMKLATTTQSTEAWLYAARLICCGTTIPVCETLEIIGCSLSPQGFIALLGRNFLRGVVFVYDGPAGFFTLL